MTAAPSHVRAPKALNKALPQHESLAHMLLAAVDAQPDLPALIFEQQRVTYTELGRAERTARGRGRGRLGQRRE